MMVRCSRSLKIEHMSGKPGYQCISSIKWRGCNGAFLRDRKHVTFVAFVAAILMNLALAQENIFDPTTATSSPSSSVVPSLNNNDNVLSPSPTITSLISKNPTGPPMTLSTMPSSIIEPAIPSISYNPSLEVTATPSIPSSFSPSASSLPTFTPSASPTNYPTFSPYPSFVPSLSSRPSSTPTSSQPTSRPSELPTYSPIILPSASPSLENPVSVERINMQSIDVSLPQSFTSEETDRFQFLMEQYTVFFGYNISNPEIIPKCEMTSQNIGITPIETRRVAANSWRLWQYFQNDEVDDNTQSFWNKLIGRFHLNRSLQVAPTYLLQIRFKMMYTTRFNYDISNYNQLFADFINSNTTRVAEDLATLGLPVVAVGDVLVLSGNKPTSKPTFAPSPTPTEGPTSSTKMPTSSPSAVPSSPLPSQNPSAAPSDPAVLVDTKSDSFVLGISLGVSGALAIGILLFCYLRHKETKDHNKAEMENAVLVPQSEKVGDVSNIMNGDGSSNMAGDDDFQHSTDIETSVPDNTMGTEAEEISPNDGVVGTEEVNVPMTTEPSQSVTPNKLEASQIGNEQYDQEPTNQPLERESIDSCISTSPDVYTNLFSLPYHDGDELPSSEMFNGAEYVMHNASFNSESDDEVIDPYHFDGSRDELDNYKNQDLELLRNIVEENVDGVEGMMSLAMTGALMEAEDSMSWVVARDHASIEATCLCETYDWLKKNEHSSLEERNEYFQDWLNKIVLTVLFGMSNPVQGARLAHGCATILGLELLRELPHTALVIQGMRKINDLEQGRRVILEAFKPFGEIEDAALAPHKKGFGFVRFRSAKSVQRALERYRLSEIEIQDVSVSVKTIKSENPPF